MSVLDEATRLRIALISLLVLMIAISTDAQSAGAKGSCTVEGAVVADVTGAPLRGAVIRLVKLEEAGEAIIQFSSEDLDEMTTFRATSDSNGHFRFEEVPPGTYKIMAERSGYVSQVYGQKFRWDGGTKLTLEASQNVRDIMFRLVAQGVIAGRVFDEHGEPVPGVKLHAVLRLPGGDGDQFESAVAVETNDRGEYRLYGLDPGKYVVGTMRPEEQSFGLMMRRMSAVTRSNAGRAEGREVPGRIYYPGTSNLKEATTIIVAAGQEVSGIDLTLTTVRVFVIRGRVIDAATGLPATKATVSLNRDTEISMVSGSETSFVLKDGTFEIRDIEPGQHIISAYTFGRENDEAAGNSEDKVGWANVTVLDGDVTDVVILLRAPMQIKGKIQWERPEDRVQGVEVRFSSSERRTYGIDHEDDGTVNDDGSFHVYASKPGEHHLYVSNLPEERYVKTIRVGKRKTGQTVDVPEGGLSDLLIVEIGTATGEVLGEVLDANGKSVAGVMVSMSDLSKDLAHGVFHKSATSDQNGRFVLRGIPPGQYHIYPLHLDAESGVRYSREMLSIRVDLGGKHNVSLRLPAP